MPPKSKRGANAPKSKGGEEEREEPLQALVFADSYETTFAPFTLERPRCLLPLANTPLIEYTLEFLASAGVEEVYLYCSNHTEMVENYLRRSKWTKETAPFSLDIIRSDARSIGDAMRDLDHKQLITGDFICVYGDVVAELPMEAAIAAHRGRREKNKKSIMTMVLREAGERHRTKSQLLRPAFVIDPKAGRCVHYEQVRPGRSPRLDIAEEVLKEHVEVEVREDLIDCGIDICTPEVLAQYTDNFDWQAPRRGFLYGVLKDYETNQLMIHTHVTSEGYAARVKNLRLYNAVSRDVVGRWAYPLCPDVNLLSDQSYQLHKGNVYKEDGVVLARSSVVGRNSVLGKATSVGEGTVIRNSVVGRRCVIGKHVQLDGAYVWDDARIGDGAVVRKSVIANEAAIGGECHISSGALISYGVTIGRGITVTDGKRITRATRRQSDGKAERSDTNPKVVGEDGEGYELPVDEDEEDPLEPLTSDDLYDVDDATLSDDSISTLDSEDEDESIDTESKRRSSRSESFTSINSDESGDTRRKAADFHHEATASIVDALQKNEDVNNIQLELQALKLSSNAEDKQVRRAVAVSLMKRIAGLVESGSSPNDAVKKVLLPNELLIQRCVATEKDEYEEQVEFLLYMQTDLVHRQQGNKILLFVSNVLAQNDLLEAEGFQMWWDDARSSATEELVRVRGDTERVVETLNAEDESENDEDEDSD